MDRPERPEQSEPSSIFSKPDHFDEPAPPPAPAPAPRESTLDPMDVSTWGPPAQPQRDAYSPRPGGTLPPSSDGSGPSRRKLTVLAAAGGIAILAMSFIVFSILGNETPPPVAAGDVSPTPSASPSAEPTIAATPEATPRADARADAGRPAGGACRW